jgi:hypothetical protein
MLSMAAIVAAGWEPANAANRDAPGQNRTTESNGRGSGDRGSGNGSGRGPAPTATPAPTIASAPSAPASVAPSAQPTAAATASPSASATPRATASTGPSPSATSSPVQQATVTPAPTPAPAPTSPPAAAGLNPSGLTIPPPLAGYRRHHFTEFPNETRLGDGLHPDTLRYLQPRPSVSQDCTYRDSSGRGVYCTRRTTYESGGLLRQWLHTENKGQSGISHVPTGDVNYVSGLKWTVANQADFVVSFVARFDDIPGRKVAYLRWCGPRIGEPGYCEDNFPEAKLEPGPRGNAFHHHEGQKTQNSYSLNTELDRWHLYQMHVKAGRFVDFYLDGRLIGHATQGVTSSPSYWVFQAETYLGGQALPYPHNQGWIEFDSYALDLPG